MLKKTAIVTGAFILHILVACAQQNQLITDIGGRKTVSLNGKWQYIVDPYETGFYDYRFKERQEKDNDAFWNSDVPNNKYDHKEYGYSDKNSLKVPGDWNSQDAKFLYYEGTVWYKRTFDYKKTNASNRVFLYFGAANYKTDVYLNGKKLGQHIGGFTPFNFEIPDSVIKAKGNYLVVKVDNKRGAEEIPTLNTDWWNYGGITRDVKLVELPANFIRGFSLQLTKLAQGDNKIQGNVKLDQSSDVSEVQVEIPELKLKQRFPANNNIAAIDFTVANLQYWSPKTPKLYRVIVTAGNDKLEDKIGFRTIEAKGQQLLLNGKHLFLRGISIHEEIPQEGRRAYSKADALQLLGWAKELNCNMVRLAHYPHDESMTRMADSLGILVWSEIPVYWTINFKSEEVLGKAKQQLTEMITRDENRASVIVWSVGNETPISETRTNFMHTLLQTAKELDPTRLASAALEVSYKAEGKNINLIDDPLGKYVDMVSFNEYLGWYLGTPDSCKTANWATIYDKPLFISETGAEAKGGFISSTKAMWSEDYQAWYYKEQIAMLKRMPASFSGISPWILADFRSPRRNNPTYQQGWNTKGLIDRNGKKKKAFFLLKEYYGEMEKMYP